jgi:hypothetical protein
VVKENLGNITCMINKISLVLHFNVSFIYNRFVDLTKFGLVMCVR